MDTREPSTTDLQRPWNCEMPHIDSKQPAGVQPLTLQYWVVCRNREIPEGTVIGEYLSPAFETETQAAEALAKIKEQHSAAYIQNGAWLFDPLKAEDMATRSRLLAKLQRTQ